MGDFNGQWQQLPAGAITVTVGNDSNGAGLWTTQSTSYNTVQWVTHPMFGHEDIVLIGLEDPVPANEATPRTVLYDAPSGLSGSSTLTVYGWNQSCSGTGSCLRRSGTSRSYSSAPPNYFNHVLDFGVTLDPGDSGGPTLFGGTSGALMGVNQSGGGSSFVGSVNTFGKGDLSANRPNVSAWLKPNTLRSFCSATGTTVSQFDGGNHRQLHSWYSPTRFDNIAHTSPSWAGCMAGYDRFLVPDYQFWRNEGWVASPDRPQPAGTVPLNLYWSSSAKDNAVSTSHPGGSWSYVSLLGYVWTSSGSGRIPLKRWFSAARQDYLTTSSGINYSGSGYVDQGVIGWVRSPSSSL